MAKLLTPEMARINRKITLKSGEKRKYSLTRDAWRRFKRNKTAVAGVAVIIILILLAIFAKFIVPYDVNALNPEASFQRPSLQHLFGTDMYGRDMFSRCIYGARYSLPIGLICMCTELLTGGLLGMVSAFFAGKFDMLFMRLIDIIQAIPGTLLAILVVAVLGTGLPQLILAVTISFLPGGAKTVRAAIFTVKNNEYIDAGRLIGLSNIKLMLRHMLPNSVGYIIIQSVSSIPLAIMVVSSLSYLGLGIMPPTPEWGALLNANRAYLQSYPYLVLFPGLMIFFTVLAFNLFGNGLRDALDPRLK